MTINVIACDLPHINAYSETTEDPYHYNVYIKKNLSSTKAKEELKHKLSHIIHDDFYSDLHVDLIEKMVRTSIVSDSELEGINFYFHEI